MKKRGYRVWRLGAQAGPEERAVGRIYLGPLSDMIFTRNQRNSRRDVSCHRVEVKAESNTVRDFSGPFQDRIGRIENDGSANLVQGNAIIAWGEAPTVRDGPTAGQMYSIVFALA